jgi:hypothetical protein
MSQNINEDPSPESSNSQQNGEHICPVFKAVYGTCKPCEGCLKDYPAPVAALIHEAPRRVSKERQRLYRERLESSKELRDSEALASILRANCQYFKEGVDSVDH